MAKIDLLLKYLKQYGSITKLKAAEKFHIYGLKHTINSLIYRYGYNIETVMIQRANKQAYARYTLVAK